MDWCVLQEVLLLLFVVVLQIVNGFSIRGHSGNTQNQRQGAWSSDVDSIRDIKDRIQFAHFPQQDNNINSHQQDLHQPVFAPEESFLYNTFASLNRRENNLKRSMTQFSTGSDDISYEKGIADNSNDDNDDQNSDDEIDVIATISYPKNGKSALDNLSLSTKLGLLALPSKRQQGWYVQYGKRTASRDSSKENADDSNLIIYDEMRANSETSNLPFSTPSEDARIARPSTFRLNLESGPKLEQLEHDMKLRNIAYNIMKSVINDKSKDLFQPHSSVKRQQGWFTQYGKRSSQGVQHSFS